MSLDGNPAPEDEAQDDEVQDEAAMIHARAYQLEMFEESLKRNIIVAVRVYKPLHSPSGTR